MKWHCIKSRLALGPDHFSFWVLAGNFQSGKVIGLGNEVFLCVSVTPVSWLVSVVGQFTWHMNCFVVRCMKD